MPPVPIIQFTELRQLAAEIRGYDEVRVTTLQQIQTTESATLVQKEIQIGVAVRLISGLGHVKAWYHEIDRLSFYQYNHPEGHSPEQERFNQAMAKARELQTAVVAYLQTVAEEIKADLGGIGVGCTVHTDGLIDVGHVPLLPGTHHLVLPEKQPLYDAYPQGGSNGHH